MTYSELRHCLQLVIKSDGRYVLRLAEQDKAWHKQMQSWMLFWELCLVDCVKHTEAVYRDYSAFSRDWPGLRSTNRLVGHATNNWS